MAKVSCWVFLDVNWLKKSGTERNDITVRKKFRTVGTGLLLRTVFLQGTKLRYGMFLEEYGTENNSVPYRSNPLVTSDGDHLGAFALGNTTLKKRRSVGEPLATLCRFDRPGNGSTDLPNR